MSEENLKENSSENLNSQENNFKEENFAQDSMTASAEVSASPYIESENVDSMQKEEIDLSVNENDSLEAEILALQKQNEELNAEKLRLYADFENTKKRLARDKDIALEYAYENIAKDLLPSIDALQNALNAANTTNLADISDTKEHIEKMREGICLVMDNLLKALAKHEIVPIDTSGEFDPNLHNAIMQVESQKPSGSIVAELQKGYKYKERTLRASMVSVAK